MLVLPRVVWELVRTGTPVRKKSEVYWSGLVGKTLPANTDVNLVQFLKALPAAQYGTLTPFFNTVSNKMNVFNSSSTVSFKVNLVGTWAGGSSMRSMQLDFLGTSGNRLVASRDVAVTSDVITLATFFSVDEGGNLVHNGTEPVIRSNSGAYTVSAVLVVAEQVTAVRTVSAV